MRYDTDDYDYYDDGSTYNDGDGLSDGYDRTLYDGGYTNINDDGIQYDSDGTMYTDDDIYYLGNTSGYDMIINNGIYDTDLRQKQYDQDRRLGRMTITNQCGVMLDTQRLYRDRSRQQGRYQTTQDNYRQKVYQMICDVGIKGTYRQYRKGTTGYTIIQGIMDGMKKLDMNIGNLQQCRKYMRTIM